MEILDLLRINVRLSHVVRVLKNRGDLELAAQLSGIRRMLNDINDVVEEYNNGIVVIDNVPYYVEGKYFPAENSKTATGLRESPAIPEHFEIEGVYIGGIDVTMAISDSVRDKIEHRILKQIHDNQGR
jgi:hypothetical protein